VAQVRLRNLLVSFGVLLLLGASMGMVLMTTGRARRLAAQQMEFVAGVSHELRTPLAVIRSAAENLADGVVEDPKQVKRYGDVIAGEGRRLTHMVEQIMEFAGFESGRVSLDVRPADVGGIVEDALRAAAPHVREHHASIDHRLTPALPPVLVDAAAVSRSIQNLIVNALKYGGTPPAVAIDARSGDPAKREVLVTVSDNGAGIAARDLPHIFEPFYRGGDATARQIHGSGLGLSLVKRIMDEIGGRITVRTDAGKGSAFTLHLPLAPEGAREAGPAGALADPRATTT
jgi:signal transduction histidine kinase